MRKLELLAPAANKEIAREAILHGADAIYIGASSHGARRNASNSLEDIKELVDFAHTYRVRVYVTVNTLVYDREISDVEQLISDLYRIGVDALIVQDMGILRMDIPPVQLHASTQCDTRTPEKAQFLQEAGFSQIVLARELSLKEIEKICDAVSVPVECFIHGALCVCYSGRCQVSQASMGRSANRGECSQMCRLPYSLFNGDGEEIITNRYLLSLSDFNASAKIEDMVKAGVSSFKIEGRLKDAAYVKNVTAAYRMILDGIIAQYPDKYCRASYGTSSISFEPSLEKAFNRGFTDYFLEGRRRDRKMASILTPKSHGEIIRNITDLNNGDGISYLNPATGEIEGCRVNRIDRGRIITGGNIRIPYDAELHRTYDVEWQKALSRPTAERKIWLDITIDDSGISGYDERGVMVRIPLNVKKQKAKKPMDIRPIFSKLGNTIYKLRNFENHLAKDIFIPASELTALRHALTDALDKANVATYSFEYRKKENKEMPFPYDHLDSRDNVSNPLARKFYEDHKTIIDVTALEVGTPQAKADTDKGRVPVMTTRYCLRRELGCCRKAPSDPKLFKKLKEPLELRTGPHRFRLDFDCEHCEMNVFKS